MGQNQPRGNQSAHQAKHSKFNKVTYPIKIFDKQTELMEVQLPSDQTSYQKWKQDLKIYEKQFPHKKYLLLPQNHKYHNAGMCSQSGTAKITYPKLPYILEDEILSIKAKKNTFSESEIWKLLHVVVEAKNEYLSLGKTFYSELGNVNPKHIFLNQHNEIKLANPLSWPNYVDGYKSAVLRETAYLSPEDVKLLELGALNNDANSRSEDFSIGMTLLSVGLVENLQNLYNFDKPSFNSKQFDERLILWKTTLYYSEILRAVVLSFLETNPQKRLTFNQAREFLKPHVANIHDSRPLVINSVNPKIQKKVDQLVKELPDLLKYRFEKYSPQKQLPKSISKDAKNNSLPKETKQSQIDKVTSQVRKNEIPKDFKNVIVKNDKPQTILPPGGAFQIGRAVQQLAQPGQIQPASITRVKSQTRFTYSNRPLQNVSPNKFVVNGQNGAVIPQQTLIPQLNRENNGSRNYTFQPVIQNPTQFTPPNNMIYSPRVNKITYESNPQPLPSPKEPSLIISTDYMLESKKPVPKILTTQQKNSQEIAQRLVKQGLKHTDSQIHANEPNRESAQTEINKLEHLEAGNPTALRTNSYANDRKSYHTYAEVLINSDFGAVWNEFLNLVHRPETYFAEIEHIIKVTDGVIEVPPGRVRLETNREEGKIHLENVSQKCTGEILGGVSKKSPEEVQVWFNSSYQHNGEPFPTSEYFVKGLKKLKQKVQRKNVI